MDNYQIFISYRRDGGDALAGRLADRFKALGYKVFFDVESMRSGAFNTQLLEAIERCNDVLLVLPPNALDRCVNENDWVRRELAFAIEQNKNIIPILMRGFEFPETLPDEIDKIRYMEGVTASSEYFDAVIERIEKLLFSSIKKAPQKGSVTFYGFKNLFPVVSTVNIRINGREIGTVSRGKSLTYEFEGSARVDLKYKGDFGWRYNVLTLNPGTTNVQLEYGIKTLVANIW